MGQYFSKYIGWQAMQIRLRTNDTDIVNLVNFLQLWSFYGTNVLM